MKFVYSSKAKEGYHLMAFLKD